ncbi:MAG: AAA family ATPase, partial [Phaeodactylibacter sp.]|nr:AAA family ATPase [Phaeodactylibacter sp.]
MIDRILEQRLAQELQSSQKIIILYGSRQVGKTTLIHKVLRQLNKKTLFVNADSGEYVDILSSRDPLRLKRLIG